MRIPKHFLALLGIFLSMVLVLGCNPSVKPGDNGVLGESTNDGYRDKKTLPGDYLPPIVPKVTSSYGIVVNTFFIEYCLPYPKEEFARDQELPRASTENVFVSKDKKSKISYRASMLAIPFEDLYSDYEKEVAGEPGVEITVDIKEDDGFRLAWTQGDRTTYERKWHRVGADEMVEVTFEFPTEQERKFRDYIFVITGQTSYCD